MENEDLKDILLDKGDESKSKRIKKMLILAAVLVNVFLIVIVAMKILNSNDTNMSQNEIDSRLVLPPAPTQPATQTPPATSTPAVAAQPPVQEKKVDDKLFEQVPIAAENKGKDEFEDMVKKLKEKENAKVAQRADSKPPVAVAKESATPTEVKPEPKTEEKTATTALATTPKAESKKTEAKKSEDKSNTSEAKSKSKSKDKTQPKQAAKAAAPTATKSGVYVQVFAVGNFNPNHELIKKLKAQGYDYQTLKVGDMTKVLVGPYDSSELNKNLVAIRKNINKNAFIYRAK